MQKNEPSRIYPEHIVSAYILFKSRQGDQHITPKEVDSLLPNLAKDNTLELRKLSYISTAIGKYSPEIRGYFVLLDDMHYSLFRHESETMVLPEGIEHAESIIGKLWHESPSAVNGIENTLEKASKNWTQKNKVA